MLVEAIMEETKAEPGTYKSICVIGGGASGLIVMKELLEVGINVSNNTDRHNAIVLRKKDLYFFVVRRSLFPNVLED